MDYYINPIFNGEDTFWKFPSGFTYTGAVKNFCEENRAYWVLDLVQSYYPKIKTYDFLILYFDIKDSSCSFYAKEDSDTPKIITQEIEYTDLQVSMKLYFCNNTLMFPSDY